MKFQKGNQAAKGRTNPREFANMLRVAVKESQGDKSKLRVIAEKLVAEAMDGNIRAIREVADRLDGKPSQSHQLSGEGGGAIEFSTNVSEDAAAFKRSITSMAARMKPTV